MRISRAWLSDYVDFSDLSLEAFSELITTRVAEVDKIEIVGAPREEAVLCAVTKVGSHPKKPNLLVATVNLGNSEVQVVCGTPNCAEKILAAYLPPGAQYFSATENQLRVVESRTIEGVQSTGILVSERELELSADHSGILVFDTKAGFRPGEKLSTKLGGSDVILVIDNKSLTHRPDLWSHFGFAREIAAVLQRPLKISLDRFADDTPQGVALLQSLGQAKPTFRIHIDQASRCPRFSGLVFENITVKTSPLWLRSRLFAVGVGVRNLVVDLSNYVMHDTGQPNHAYDVRKLTGKEIFVRQAKENEEFVGLDSVTRVLSAQDVVITDRDRALALGGVIGGASSAISETTCEVFLESANFDPVLIRLTTKRHQVRTDASNRFEKNQSPFSTPLALHRFAELLHEIEPQIKIGAVADTFVERPKPVNILFSFSSIQERLGVAIDEKKIQSILTTLEFQFEENKQHHALVDGQYEKRLNVRVPYFRATRDVTIIDDLVEEVGRIFGYENIPESVPRIPATAQKHNVLKAFEYSIRDTLTALGFAELSNYSFENGVKSEELGFSQEDNIQLLNPVDTNKANLRTSLIPGMLESLEQNSRFAEKLLFYELGRTYGQKEIIAHQTLSTKEQVKNPAGFERRILCLGYTSGREERVLHSFLVPELESGANFYALLGVLQKVVRLVSYKPLRLIPIVLKTGIEQRGHEYLSASFPENLIIEEVLASKPTPAEDLSSYKRWMHPFRSSSLVLDTVVIGVLAEAREGILNDLPSRSVIAEIDVELLLGEKSEDHVFQPLPKYPDSFFEMSVIMPYRTPYRELESLIHRLLDPKILRGLEVLAVYQGAPLKQNEKSVSVRVFFGAEDRTLSGEELSLLQTNLVASVKAEGFSLRQ